MAALSLCYYSSLPCTSKGGISASVMCHFWGFVFSFNIWVGLITLSLAFWYPILWLFILLCCVEGKTVNELEVVDCTLELTFHSSSDVVSITELTFWIRKETNCFFKL